MNATGSLTVEFGQHEVTLTVHVWGYYDPGERDDYVSPGVDPHWELEGFRIEGIECDTASPSESELIPLVDDEELLDILHGGYVEGYWDYWETRFNEDREVC